MLRSMIALRQVPNQEHLQDLGPLVFYHCSQLTRRLLLPIIEEQCLAIRPPEAYFVQWNSVCLAVHTNPAVRDHLWLSAYNGLLLPAEFGRKLLGAMRLNIELALTTDRAVLIRTLAIMSLFAYTRDALELHCYFRVFVRISALLERAIELYRPNCTSIKIPTSDFPSFEDVLGECEALKLPTHLIETLELFYHAVGILLCRSQTIASNRVLLPYVLYAISLSLSTAHRQIRYSRVLKFQTIARRKSAAVIAELARKSLFEARSLHAGEPDAGRSGGSPSAAVQQDVAGTANAGKQTMYESNDLNEVEELGDLLWRLYNKPVDASIIDLDEYSWNVDHLNELLDNNLELSLLNFFPKLSVDIENTF
ncbi:hypothetical protein M433DRAFT_160120 [Acidomyces richmondensis BFW]|nr:hypothetical protein M433DRAFT_160120 [Acidomyces richmondensis BFW]